MTEIGKKFLDCTKKLTEILNFLYSLKNFKFNTQRGKI